MSEDSFPTQAVFKEIKLTSSILCDEICLDLFLCSKLGNPQPSAASSLVHVGPELVWGPPALCIGAWKPPALCIQARLRRCIGIIASLDRLLTTIVKHRWRLLFI